MTTTIDEELRKMKCYSKKAYFKWKFNIWYDNLDKKKMTPDEFLKYVDRKSFVPFERWERTPEYERLVNIYLNSKSANDLLEVYEKVSEKAKEGDDKAINQLLKLQKEIKANIKSSKAKNVTEEDDGLVI